MVRGEHTSTTVEPLGAAVRQEEIARMLAGEVVTPAARAAAAALLDGRGPEIETAAPERGDR
jgi:DNA repair protein RecN (Recombination protein N)